MIDSVKDIFDKHQSQENIDYFEREVLPGEKEIIKRMHGVNDEDVEQILHNYPLEYQDTAIVMCIHENVTEYSKEQVEHCESFQDHLRPYFDFKQYGEDCVDGNESVWHLVTEARSNTICNFPTRS